MNANKKEKPFSFLQEHLNFPPFIHLHLSAFIGGLKFFLGCGPAAL